MQKKPLQRTTQLLALATILTLPARAQAQAQNNQAETEASEKVNTNELRFWRANLPGGTYIVALDKISSISKHRYILNGALEVTEVVIDTNGNALARFYAITPVGSKAALNNASSTGAKVIDKISQVSQRGGIDPRSTVVKEYPNTTHAKTIEFNISNENTLNQLFTSAQTAWTSQRGRVFTLDNK